MTAQAIVYSTVTFLGFLDSAVVKNPPANAGGAGGAGLILGRKDPLE